MSRIGKIPIPLPSGATVAVEEGIVKVKGPKGELAQSILELTSVKIEDNNIIVERANDSKRARAMHGTLRSVLANLVHGVTQGYERKLQIIGVGYSVVGSGNTLNMKLGFSHPVDFTLPDGVSAQVDRGNIITLSSNDKQLVGETAAKLRRLRPPEPYKGKGVRYFDEHVRIKEGKKNI
jgi:large subunit ribosomal protein L6